MNTLKYVFLAALIAPAAQASILSYTTVLSGSLEVPPTGSPGTGTATVIIDTILNTMQVEVAFSGLGAASTASHIHCCTSAPLTGNAGVATTTPSFPGFPLGVTAGFYDQTFDLTSSSTYNPAFVTAEGGVANAEAALLTGIAAGETYLNIHTMAFPGGEIRGYLQAAPEPATLFTAALAAAGLAFIRRKRD
jgi:hypothetical protein